MNRTVLQRELFKSILRSSYNVTQEQVARLSNYYAKILSNEIHRLEIQNSKNEKQNTITKTNY
jgi:hypothetical protein